METQKIRLILSMLLLALLASACGDSKPKEEPEKKGLPKTGGGYYGAVFRAREQAQKQLGKVNAIRKEQVQEEKDWDKRVTPDPNGTPRQSSTKATPAANDPQP